MAIKKGAFEQYTKERQLPKKRINVSKKVHFFDEVDNISNHPQLIHERFTSEAGSTKPSSPTHESGSNIDNGSQLVHERFTSEAGSTKPSSPPLESESNIDNGSQLIHEKLRSRVQEKIPSKANLNRLVHIVGNQRKIIFALFKNTRTNKAAITEELSLDMISALSGVNKKSLKNTLFRLKNKGYIKLVDQKIGRCGWVRYQIDYDIVNELKNFY